jgi:hypothetical protein
MKIQIKPKSNHPTQFKPIQTQLFENPKIGPPPDPTPPIQKTKNKKQKMEAPIFINFSTKK